MNADRWQQVVALSAGEEEILPLRTTDPQYQLSMGQLLSHKTTFKIYLYLCSHLFYIIADCQRIANGYQPHLVIFIVTSTIGKPKRSAKHVLAVQEDPRTI